MPVLSPSEVGGADLQKVYSRYEYGRQTRLA